MQGLFKERVAVDCSRTIRVCSAQMRGAESEHASVHRDCSRTTYYRFNRPDTFVSGRPQHHASLSIRSLRVRTGPACGVRTEPEHAGGTCIRSTQSIRSRITRIVQCQSGTRVQPGWVTVHCAWWSGSRHSPHGCPAGCRGAAQQLRVGLPDAVRRSQGGVDLQ